MRSHFTPGTLGMQITANNAIPAKSSTTLTTIEPFLFIARFYNEVQIKVHVELCPLCSGGFCILVCMIASATKFSCDIEQL